MEPWTVIIFSVQSIKKILFSKGHRFFKFIYIASTVICGVYSIKINLSYIKCKCTTKSTVVCPDLFKLNKLKCLLLICLYIWSNFSIYKIYTGHGR